MDIKCFDNGKIYNWNHIYFYQNLILSQYTMIISYTSLKYFKILLWEEFSHSLNI